MKRLVPFLVALILPSLSIAAPKLDLGKGFSVSIDTGMDLNTVGAYDFNNGQWLSGFSKELFPVTKDGKKIAYLAAEQLFNISEAGKGSFGMAFGVPTGPVTSLLQEWTVKLVPSSKLPPWVMTLSEWTSFEVGAGYRFFGSSPDTKPWVYTIGGQVRIPLDSIRSLWSKKAQ